MRTIWPVLLGLLLLAAPAAVQAQFTYATNNGAITLTECSGTGGAVVISNFVTSIGADAFENCSGLTSVTIPGSVTSIGAYAFCDCTGMTNATISNGVTTIGEDAFCCCLSLKSVTIPGRVTNIASYAFMASGNLTSVCFTGNAPTADLTVFSYDNNATVYYLPGTTGWSNTFAGLPTAPWFLPNPMVLNNGTSLGVQNNAFGFTISWATNISVVVEACTNLASPVWVPLQTNALANGSCSFSDPQWTNFPSRYYRISSQ